MEEYQITGKQYADGTVEDLKLKMPPLIYSKFMMLKNFQQTLEHLSMDAVDQSLSYFIQKQIAKKTAKYNPSKVERLVSKEIKQWQDALTFLELDRSEVEKYE